MPTVTPPGLAPVRSSPPEAWEPLLRLAQLARRPIDRFLGIEAASGIVLLVATVVALVWANSPWAASYESLRHARMGVRLGGFAFERSFEWFVNDVLMAIFFFVVGMEIHGESHHGALSEWRQAVLPAFAALGGMVVPAGLYLALAGNGPARSGWGIPMATDIAFAVGVLQVVGKRAPASLRILLLALAVIDDLGAIVIIALFYTRGIHPVGIGVLSAGVAMVFTLRAIGVRRPAAYFAPACIVWAGTYSAGVHPAIAGVILGFLTPVRAWLGPEGFVAEMRDHTEHFAEQASRAAEAGHGMNESLRRLDVARREAISPAELMIDRVHPWVAFLIMPLFAFTNAGVALNGLSLDRTTATVSLAIGVGLVLGKPVGVVVASLVALRSRIAILPSGLSSRHLVVLGGVAGIGFTMSLFVAQLAFEEQRLLDAAKLGVLSASGVAMLLSLGTARLLLPKATESAGSDQASVLTP